MKRPKRLFRQRPILSDIPDRRLAEYTEGPLVADPPDLSTVMDLEKHVVYIPMIDGVKADTQDGIDGLRDLGIRVEKYKGSSAIDLARSSMASKAVLEGLDSFLFIDADMRFNPGDAVKLLLSDEPVIAGLYAAKSLGKAGKFNCDFGLACKSIDIGEDIGKMYPVDKVGTGFMRIKVDFLKRMIRELELPYCRMGYGFGWPFFMPMVVDEDGGNKYLPEDMAFCRRCCDMGIKPIVDTSFRIYHVGDYNFGVEEAARQYVERIKNQRLFPERPLCGPFSEPNLDLTN